MVCLIHGPGRCADKRMRRRGGWCGWRLVRIGAFGLLCPPLELVQKVLKFGRGPRLVQHAGPFHAPIDVGQWQIGSVAVGHQRSEVVVIVGNCSSGRHGDPKRQRRQQTLQAGTSHLSSPVNRSQMMGRNTSCCPRIKQAKCQFKVKRACLCRPSPLND